MAFWYFGVLSKNQNKKWFWMLQINCTGRDGSFDTHIAMVCDILCRMTFVIVCHKMTFMTDVIWHKVSWTIAIWVSNEPSRLVQLIYSIQNHFLFWFLDKNSKYQNANISLCNSLSKTKRPKMRMKMTSNHFRPLAKCF